MNTLGVLEEKITSLVALVKGLKELNSGLHASNEALKVENQELKLESQELKKENAKLAEDVDQLVAQLADTKGLVSRESKELQKLSKEKEATKTAVEDLLDLIQGIDALVEGESQ